MPDAFVHETVLSMAAGADDRAPGAAVTVALCGAVEHEPPCPLAPHFTSTDRSGGGLSVRVLFVTAPENEGEVRQRIDAALHAPGGGWRVHESRSGLPTPEEQRQAARMAQSL